MNCLTKQGAQMSKIKLEDFFEIGKMLEVYGKLLSEERQNIMTAYFEYNMTLVEIAQEKGISRQAVLDSIDKSSAKLKEYEKILHLVEKEEKIKKQLEDVCLMAKQSSQKLIEEKVEKILKEI